MKHSFPQFKPPKGQKRLVERLATAIEQSPVFEDEEVEIVWDNWKEFEPYSYLASIVATVNGVAGCSTEFEVDIDVQGESWFARLLFLEPTSNGGQAQVGSVIISDITPEELPGVVEKTLGFAMEPRISPEEN